MKDVLGHSFHIRTSGRVARLRALAAVACDFKSNDIAALPG